MKDTRDKLKRAAFPVFVVILMATRAFAQAQGGGPSWGEHLDVVNALIALLLGYAIWSVKSMRDEIKAILRDHDERIMALEKDLNILYGEHKALHT